MILIHPTDLTLSLFSTDDLAPSARRRVASHVGRCEKCFAYVAGMRSTAAIAAALPAPGASEDGLALIRARRAASERMLLPSATADVPWTGRSIAWPIAAAVALIAAVAVFSSAPELSAVAVESDLTMAPAAPRAGDRIKVTYRPTPALFSQDDRLILRARVRTPSAQAYDRGTTVIVLGVLTRDGGGTFRGVFALPDSVVFATLAVEDTAASVVDDRTGRPWDVLVHDADGRPTFESLEQRQNDYMGRSWEEAYATARRKAELYPDNIRSWEYLAFFEEQVLGEAAADSAANTRLPMMHALLAAYREAPSVPADELATIVFRAWAQKDTAAWDYWWERARLEAPHHPQTAQQATLRARMKYPRNSAHDRLLVDLEQIWARHGPVVGDPGNLLFQAALSAATQAKDVSAYRRWAHRSMEGDPSVVSYYAGSFLRYPELRDEGLAMLRDDLVNSRFASRYPRPLGDTREAYARTIAAHKRWILAAIGRGLIDSGNPRGGLDTLALAVSDGWSLALFEQVAAARRIAGDTLGALAIEAKIAADPRTSAAKRDSMTTVGTRLLGETSWTRSVADARKFMTRTFVARSVVRFVTGDPRVTDAAGRPFALRELILNKPAVVVYWSRYCGPALESLARIDSVATVLRSEGAAAFLIVDEPPSPEFTAFLKEQGVATPVYHDTRREVSSALRNFGTPAYYVFDTAGRIRFTHASPESELLVQVAAVRDKQRRP